MALVNRLGSIRRWHKLLLPLLTGAQITEKGGCPHFPTRGQPLGRVISSQKETVRRSLDT